jgi:hypothetical protein
VPLQIDVSLFWGEVVADFVHEQLSFINESIARGNVPVSQRLRSEMWGTRRSRR